MNNVKAFVILVLAMVVLFATAVFLGHRSKASRDAHDLQMAELHLQQTKIEKGDKWTSNQ